LTKLKRSLLLLKQIKGAIIERKNYTPLFKKNVTSYQFYATQLALPQSTTVKGLLPKVIR